jgi:hypothetical protein
LGGNRIEQVSQHHAGDERQENFAQRHNDRDDHREHCNPEYEGRAKLIIRTEIADLWLPKAAL